MADRPQTDYRQTTDRPQHSKAHPLVAATSDSDTRHGICTAMVCAKRRTPVTTCATTGWEGGGGGGGAPTLCTTAVRLTKAASVVKVVRLEQEETVWRRVEQQPCVTHVHEPQSACLHHGPSDVGRSE